MPASVAIDPTGRFLYTANGRSNDISVFSMDEGTGALTPRQPEQVFSRALPMATVIAALLFFFGVFIALLSAYLVLDRERGRQWYALPSCYCVLVGVLIALVGHARIDIPAIVFFSAITTLIGWMTAKAELRRRRWR